MKLLAGKCGSKSDELGTVYVCLVFAKKYYAKLFETSCPTLAPLG